MTKTVVGKWNYDLQGYESYELPEFATNYETNMDMIIHCAQCGHPAIFGQCFTSKEVHNDIGMGYSVCPQCHNEERKRQEAFNKKRGF